MLQTTFDFSHFQKYLRLLKSPENVGLVDASVVDEIFYQVMKYYLWSNEIGNSNR